MLEYVRLYLFVFGALTIVGGLIGFLKAKSKASLIAGSISGILLLAAGYLLGTKGLPGLILGLVVSLGLAGRFITTFRRSGKLMPAGVMALLSIAGAALTMAGLSVVL